jgi:hypothetical protein
MAKKQRKALKQTLLLAAENNQLFISPDNWTDNHRKISYMGATVHSIDAQFQYQSLDLFCAEFVEQKKTAANIYQVKFSHTSKDRKLIYFRETSLEHTVKLLYYVDDERTTRTVRSR